MQIIGVRGSRRRDKNVRPGGDERNQPSWLVRLEFPLLGPTSGKAWGTFLLPGTTRRASLLIRKETKTECTSQ